MFKTELDALLVKYLGGNKNTPEKILDVVIDLQAASIIRLMKNKINKIESFTSAVDSVFLSDINNN